MRTWARYALCGVAGLALGAGAAIWSVRAGALGSGERMGAWTSGTDFGSRDAGLRDRAVVAMRGLLALPASEARYYSAEADDAGQPLDGRCSYRVAGGAVPARWWSLTLYGSDNYLVANPDNIYSVASLTLPAAEQNGWTATVAPKRQPGHWLPSSGAGHFSLTLRTYLPTSDASLTRAQLPSITRQGCA